MATPNRAKTRTPVATIFENLEAGSDIEEIIEQYDVTREQIQAVLEFAARSLDAPPVPAGARLCQSLAAACGQCEHVVQLAIRQQSAIGGDRRAVEPEHHSPVEIEPQRPAVRFTRRVRHVA